MSTYHPSLTLGPFLLGVFFNTFLYGFVTYQFAAYYRAKFNDQPAIKYMVLFLFVLDTFHSAAVIYMAWYYTITKYGNPRAVASAVWPYKFTPLGAALAALVTHMFLGFRIWRLTNSKILFGIVIGLSIPSFILSMLCSIEAWTLSSSSKKSRITPFVIAWLITQVVADIFITSTLVTIFHISRTGFRKMDTVLNRLIRGAIQTGLFGSIFSLGILLTFALLPKTNFYGLFVIPIGRIYTNTLMDSLLSRKSIKAGLADTLEQCGTNGPLRWTTNDSHGSSTLQPTGIRLDVSVQKTVHEMRDPVQVQVSESSNSAEVVTLAV